MNPSTRTLASFALAALLAICTTTSAQNTLAASTQNNTPASTSLVIVADRHIQDHLWPILVSTLIRDAASKTETPAFTGRLHIILSGKDTPGPSFPSRIEVELLGRCDSLWDQNAPQQSGPVGWVYGKPGQIAPVIYVDCARIGQVTWPATRSMPDNQRFRITSEAISHVILHEWIHIASQSPTHASHGIMQPQLTERELIAPMSTNESLALGPQTSR